MAAPSGEDGGAAEAAAPLAASGMSAIDLTRLFPPPYDQGDTQACASFAVTAAVAACLCVQEGSPPALDPGFLHVCGQGASPNTPVSLGRILGHAVQTGVARGHFADPFDPQACASKTDRVRLAGYGRIGSSEEAMECLRGGRPVVAIVDVGPDLRTLPAGKIYRGAPAGERFSHVVCLAGFEENIWIVRNSWGSCGDNGFFLLPFGACGIFSARNPAYTIHI